jgi:cysteine synthase A
MISPCPRTWVSTAIQIIEADFNRSSDTHLLRVPLPAVPGVELYLKDESTHPSGSLKHRLARSLFLFGLCNGWIEPETTIIEASTRSMPR